MIQSPLVLYCCKQCGCGPLTLKEDISQTEMDCEFVKFAVRRLSFPLRRPKHYITRLGDNNHGRTVPYHKHQHPIPAPQLHHSPPLMYNHHHKDPHFHLQES